MKLALGRPGEAGALRAETLRIAARLGYRELIAYTLGTAGEIALAHERSDAAARPIGGSDALFAEIGVARVGEELAAYRRTLDALRRELGDDHLRRLRNLGGSRALEESVAEATAVAVAESRRVSSGGAEDAGI